MPRFPYRFCGWLTSESWPFRLLVGFLRCPCAAGTRLRAQCVDARQHDGDTASGMHKLGIERLGSRGGYLIPKRECISERTSDSYSRRLPCVGSDDCGDAATLYAMWPSVSDTTSGFTFRLFSSTWSRQPQTPSASTLHELLLAHQEAPYKPFDYARVKIHRCTV